MPISAVDAISPAFQHSKQQLLQPFRISQWLKLALVGFLSGEVMSGGGCGNLRGVLNTHQQTQQFAAPHLPGGLDPAAYAGLIAVAVVAGVILYFVFLYISSMMRFVLFDAVLKRTCEIRRSWAAHSRAGLRLFLWQIMLLLVFVVGLFILIGVPAGIGLAAGWLREPKEHPAPLILGGIAVFVVAVAYFITYFVVHVMTKDFVVPQMALEDINAIEGWRRLLARTRGEKGPYAGYLGMKLVMAIAAAAVLGVISGIVLVILLLPVGGVGALAIIGGKSAGLTWNAYTITLAVVAGTFLLGIFVYVVSLIYVPGTVFFPAYAVYFFADRYPPLRAALFPAMASVPTESGPPAADWTPPPPEPAV